MHLLNTMPMKSKKTSKSAPKLPRFKAPKDMKSKVFKTKKDKASTRRALNKKLKDNLKEEL